MDTVQKVNGPLPERGALVLFRSCAVPSGAGHHSSVLVRLTNASFHRGSLTFDLFCVWLVPDVAVEDFSENVKDTNHYGHGAEEDDSS